MGGGHGSDSSPAGASQMLYGNIAKLKKEFPLSPGGYFGGRGTSGRVRRIESEDALGTARRFFDILSRGGHVRHGPKAGLSRVDFPDGSAATLRVSSHSDGSPVVEIQLSGSRNGVAPAQKIHFVPKGES